MTLTHAPLLNPSPSSGGQLVTTCGRTLPLRSTRLVVRGAGGLATVQVVQTFANPFAEALQVRYQLPLPADAVVAGFAFVVGTRRVTGQIDRRAAARERFEQAIASGHTAGLLEQDRSALFSQELGNIAPGAEVTAEITLDQPLSWHEGQWEWRFPTTVAPRYTGQAGRVPDAERLVVAVADAPILPRLQVELLVQDALSPGGAPSSPSHPITSTPTLAGTTVQFAPANMDRDVVVRWPVAAPQPGVNLQWARPAASAPHAHEAYGLLTLVPPIDAERTPRLSRDLIVLLDISGSMQGQPLAAAQRVVGELIASLGPTDRLELVAFASRAQPWLGAPCFATEGNKAAALRWLMALRASGGTEMRDAILAALQPLRGEVQRQIVLVTDGLIGFEEEIVGTIAARLPESSRVHVVGVGSAPNRSLTRCAARAGRGLEVLVGLDDDPLPSARRLLARTAMPLVADLHIGGTALLEVCPQALPDLFAGAPCRLGVRLRPQGGTLFVRGVTASGPFRHEVQVGAIAAATGDGAVVRLVGREQVEDLEVELAANGDRQQLTARIEQLGLQFGFATRATSWVAIDTEVSVDPQDARRVVESPQELPYGMSMEGLGLRPCAMPMSRSSTLAAPGSMAELSRRAPPAVSMPSPIGGHVEAEQSLDETMSVGKAKKDSPDASRRREQVPARPTMPAGPNPPAHAVLRLRNATEWVFDLIGLPHWSLPARIVLVFADGRELVVMVVPERSTREGAVAAHTVVRLAIVAPGVVAADRPTQLRLGAQASALTLMIA